MTPLLTALSLAALGVSCVPVSQDKRPVISSWKEYQIRQPSELEVRQFFSGNNEIAIIAGRVQCLDFDEKYSRGIFRRFEERAKQSGLEDLMAGLILQETPSGGFHLVWQCEHEQRPLRNVKLASKANHEVMIETRGHGGYFLIAPSKGYTLRRGDWKDIPVLTEEDRDLILDLARSFHEQAPTQEPTHEAHTQHAQPTPPTDAGLTPGDDYDARADVPSLLRRHGWRPAGSSKYWTRPGKDYGVSASWDQIPGRFWCFSSSTQFQPEHTYRPWHLYAILECAGDYSRAAAELRRQGFGAERKRPQPAQKEVLVMRPEDDVNEEFGMVWQGLDPAGEAPTKESEEDKVRRLLAARVYDPTAEPGPLRITYKLGGVVICTPGNISAITAQAKTGKSALVSAMLAAAMDEGEEEIDTLSCEGRNTDGKAVIFIDTEQSPDDFWHAVSRAKRRAKVGEIPSWLYCYTIADLPAMQARKAVSVAIADAAACCGGVHSVIIDGIADLCIDVNDAAEANELVSEMHQTAIRYDCSIVTVIHKNPGSDKVRGHLGSQIERKAETNLTLDKEDGVTVVWSSRQRRAPIEKKTGPRFTWDDSLKMHVSVVTESEPQIGKKLREFLQLAEAVLKPGEVVRYMELFKRLQDETATPSGRKSDRTVERWISRMVEMQVLCLSRGLYCLNEKFQL